MVFRQRYRVKVGIVLIVVSGDRLLAPNAAALAVAPEQAAAAVARLDMALLGHLLAAAWAYRARARYAVLADIRLPADGMMIDPWHLAALVEGRAAARWSPGAGRSDRGAIFAAARHAMALYQWSSRPDNAQQAAINAAAAHLTMVAGRHSPLLGAACAVHTWLDQGGERPPMRAALARYWVDRGVTARPCPLLTGAAALAAAVPWTHDIWVGHFLTRSPPRCGRAGFAASDRAQLGHPLCRRGPAPRFACRRRDRPVGGRALIVGHRAPKLLGIAIKNILRLLDGLVV